VIYSLNKIPHPKSFYCSRKNYGLYYDEIVKICSLPIIIKDLRGTYGRYSFIATSKSELVNGISKLPKGLSFFVQEYIENDYDWGIIVANGEVLSAEKSFRKKGEFRNHSYLGAKEVFENICDVPKNICNIAIKANKVLGLSWARSDIIISKKSNKPYILETNRSPRITSNSP